MKPQIITLPKICDPRGNLTFVQSDCQVPFQLQRAYWIYDVPGGAERGGHSHIAQHEFIVAVSGSFNVNITDGFAWRTFHLNRPYEGLYLPPGIWRTLDNFASGSVCMTLNSAQYDEDDYIREYHKFKEIATHKPPII